MSSSIKIKKPNTFILVLFASYTTASAVLFTPAIPKVMQAFNISSNMIQATIILFLFGYAFGQLLYGPVNNKYGRKAALYLGFGIALVGEILSLIACCQHNIYLLLLGRFLTATGASSGYAITFAIVHDCYQAKEARKKLAIIMLSFAIAPGLSILIGGFLAASVGWKSSFYGLLVYGSLLLSLIKFLPETSKILDKRPYKLTRIGFQYLTILKNKTFVLYGLGCSGWSAFLYIYYTDAPFIAEQDFHFSAGKYGVVSLITVIGYVCGNFTSRAMANKFKAQQVIHFGLGFIFIGIFLLALISLSWVSWVYLYFLAVAICFTGGSMFYSNAIVLGLENVSNIAMASSMFGTLNLLGAVVCTILVSTLGIPHMGSFLMVYLGIFIMLLVLNFFAEAHNMPSYN